MNLNMLLKRLPRVDLKEGLKCVEKVELTLNSFKGPKIMVYVAGVYYEDNDPHSLITGDLLRNGRVYERGDVLSGIPLRNINGYSILQAN